MSRQSGDRSVLDETTAFLEAEPVPANEETWVVVPRVSREAATVYEHAKLAITYTLQHLGANGLPLLRAGDWNDGIDVLGRREIGTGVWMGFFLANVLSASPIWRASRATRLSPRAASRNSPHSAKPWTSAGRATITRSISPTTDRSFPSPTP